MSKRSKSLGQSDKNPPYFNEEMNCQSNYTCITIVCRIISVYLLAKWLGFFGSSVVALFYLNVIIPAKLLLTD